MKFTHFKPTLKTRPRAGRCCKNGVLGFLAVVGLCFFTPILFGFLGLAFLSRYLDQYVLFPLMLICLLVVLYGWLRGGEIIRRN